MTWSADAARVKDPLAALGAYVSPQQVTADEQAFQQQLATQTGSQQRLAVVTSTYHGALERGFVPVRALEALAGMQPPPPRAAPPGAMPAAAAPRRRSAVPGGRAFPPSPGARPGAGHRLPRRRPARAGPRRRVLHLPPGVRLHDLLQPAARGETMCRPPAS